MSRINVPDHVENEHRYVAAAEARIKFNRMKGAQKRWLAASTTAQRCIDFLTQSGEFAATETRTGDDEFDRKPHPLVKAAFGQFYWKMLQSLNEWGALTPGQEKAVLDMIEKSDEKIAARKAAHAAECAGSVHVGTVGERREFTATCQFVTSFDGDFGSVTIIGFKDDAGNVLVFKGSGAFAAIDWKRGNCETFKATIKSHGERDGVKQTILSRPKL